MANNKVITGAIAIIKVNGIAIGKMTNVRYQETIRRVPVRGLGTIIPSEQTVTEWDATLSCDSMSIDFKNDGIKDALRRSFSNVGSQVFNGNESFEDQLVLDSEGVQVDMFKKIEDVIDQYGVIKPKLEPFAIVKRCLIEGEGFDLSEGTVGRKNQSFRCLSPITYPS